MSNLDKSPSDVLIAFLGSQEKSKVKSLIAATAFAISTLIVGCNKNTTDEKRPPENCSQTDKNSSLNDNQRQAVLYYNRSKVPNNVKAENELFEAFRLVDQEILNNPPCRKEMEDLMKRIKLELKKFEK